MGGTGTASVPGLLRCAPWQMLNAVLPDSRQPYVHPGSHEGQGGSTCRMPRGLRDTRSWYLDVDPMSQVDPALVDFVARRAGRRILDVGSGLGGYVRALSDRGFDVRGLDIVEEYVQTARRLGVRADRYEGDGIPFDDDAVDTVILLEVLEHLQEPASLLREARRVAAVNVLVSTPNCTQHFGAAPIEFGHMLDIDHKQFFTVRSLRALLDGTFSRSEVIESHPLDEMIAATLLPRPLMTVYWRLLHHHIIRPRFYERLLGQAWVRTRTSP
jgi:2-polyprenyl-3-methyl-5-hydroxy-6-metoxy-1,4-benzoquinol methylase